jgi:oxygen-dependent protoporphyrinogen oxidase
MRPVAIIGGGITGLTAAFHLKQRNIPVLLLESSSRLGGVIQSVRRGGYLAEFGPNSILETSPVISDLVRALGLESRRVYSDPSAEKRYVVRGKKPVCLPTTSGQVARAGRAVHRTRAAGIGGIDCPIRREAAGPGIPRLRH